METDWLEQAVAGGWLITRATLSAGAGRAASGRAPTAWLSEHSRHAEGALPVDYGGSICEFGQDISWPLGVKRDVRDVFDRVGFFDNVGARPDFQAGATTLRARLACAACICRRRSMERRGASGECIPAVAILARTSSRAILFRHWGFDLEEPELLAPPHAAERRIGGVPAHPPLQSRALRLRLSSRTRCRVGRPWPSSTVVCIFLLVWSA